MRAYSVDLREKVIAYIESGGSRLLAAKIFSIGERTVRRWITLKKETNSIIPRPHGGGNSPKIDLKSLKEYVDSNPDKTLAELGEKFLVSTTSIWYALRKIDYVYKKNSSLSRKKRRKKS
jgi:putative transposase